MSQKKTSVIDIEKYPIHCNNLYSTWMQIERETLFRNTKMCPNHESPSEQLKKVSWLGKLLYMGMEGHAKKNVWKYIAN